MADANQKVDEKGLFIPTAEANRTVTNPKRTRQIALAIRKWAAERAKRGR